MVCSHYDDVDSPTSISLVGSLRANSTYLVGGLTSNVIDQQAQHKVQFPLLEVLLTVCVAVILDPAFRSAQIPLISVLGVFLSIATATGLLYRIATYVLHSALLWLVLLILFVTLISLGTDYAAFLLTWVREDQGSHGPRRGTAGESRAAAWSSALSG